MGGQVASSCHFCLSALFFGAQPPVQSHPGAKMQISLRLIACSLGVAIPDCKPRLTYALNRIQLN